MMESRFYYRLVIKNLETGESELIVSQSTDFEKVLNEAKELIQKGIDPAQVDVLNMNDAGLWVSIWGGEGRPG